MLWGDSSGFWEAVYGAQLPAVTRQFMPAASDRFDEAVFFAKLALEKPSALSFEKRLTWLLGAHLAAFIGIADAVKIDYEHAGRQAHESMFSEEVKLRPPDDPVSAIAAYRDLRNLRTHFAIPLVVLEQRCLLHDIARGDGDNSKARWYFKALDWSWVQRLDRPRLSEVDVHRFNRYLAERPIIDVMGQMLLVVKNVLFKDARRLEGQQT